MTAETLSNHRLHKHAPIFEMDKAEFRQWQALIEQKSGLFFDFSKYQSLLNTVITQRCRALKYNDYHTLMYRITEAPDAPMQWQLFMDELSVKTTRFFRDPDAYTFLQTYITACYQRDPNHVLECWSVGCSTGEEVYSIAYTIERCRKQLDVHADYGVMGTDMNLSVIRQARLGRYSADKVVNVDDQTKTQMFDQINQATVSVKSSLLQHVSFVQNNVITTDGLHVNELDIIFCQNVLIYFRKWQRKRVIDTLVRCLKPGGVIILGPGDLSSYQHECLERIHHSHNLVYQKRR